MGRLIDLILFRRKRHSKTVDSHRYNQDYGSTSLSVDQISRRTGGRVSRVGARDAPPVSSWNEEAFIQHRRERRQALSSSSQFPAIALNNRASVSAQDIGVAISPSPIIGDFDHHRSPSASNGYSTSPNASFRPHDLSSDQHANFSHPLFDSRATLKSPPTIPRVGRLVQLSDDAPAASPLPLHPVFKPSAPSPSSPTTASDTLQVPRHRHQASNSSSVASSSSSSSSNRSWSHSSWDSRSNRSSNSSLLHSQPPSRLSDSSSATITQDSAFDLWSDSSRQHQQKQKQKQKQHQNNVRPLTPTMGFTSFPAQEGDELDRDGWETFEDDDEEGTEWYRMQRRQLEEFEAEAKRRRAQELFDSKAYEHGWYARAEGSRAVDVTQ